MNPTPIPADATSVTIDPAQILGPVKYMNAVNNGPKKAPPSQRSENFTAYRAARIPFARIHDANYSSAYGAPHTVDVSAVFPDFDADADDPRSYDFVRTDAYLQTIAGVSLKKAVCHLTDNYRTYTEVPAEICEDGSLLLVMEPCSFVLVEW